MNLPDKKYIAAIDVHAQNTFTPNCPDELPVPEGDQIVDQLNQQAQFAQYRIGVKEAHHLSAIWVATEDKPQLTKIEGRNVDVTWRAHSIVGTKGFELIKGMPTITEYDYYVWQGIEDHLHPYGVCYHDLEEKLSTGIIEYLRCQQIKTVLVGGLATDYCVKVSVLQLLKAGFEVIVNLAACRGLMADSTSEAIATMKHAGAKFVESVEEFSKQC